MHEMGHLLEIIHGLPQAKTWSFHVGLPVLDWFIGTYLLLMMFANTFYCQLL
jgi:hypothetical protein